MKNRTHPSKVESLEITDAHNQRTAFILKSRTDKGCMSHLSGAVESPSQGLLNKLTILMKKMFHSFQSPRHLQYCVWEMALGIITATTRTIRKINPREHLGWCSPCSPRIMFTTSPWCSPHWESKSYVPLFPHKKLYDALLRGLIKCWFWEQRVDYA